MLYELKIGKKKAKLETVMIDDLQAIKFNLQSRNGTGMSGRCTGGWFTVTIAKPDAVKWKKKSTTIGGNKPQTVPTIGKNGKTRISGYISKTGFQAHT